MALVETTRQGGVVTVTLADEDNRNALSAALVGDLVEALDAAVEVARRQDAVLDDGVVQLVSSDGDGVSVSDL